MKHELLVSFDDQSKSFCYGVEYGRILEKMERGDEIVMNNGFPVRIENKAVIERTCANLGYIPSFSKTSFLDGWIDFVGIKKKSNEN